MSQHARICLNVAIHAHIYSTLRTVGPTRLYVVLSQIVAYQVIISSLSCFAHKYFGSG